ncbi:single-stranded DNA-binding protein [Candidatus Wolfebacteria bacterium RIFCSPLOWO2_01_FULL_45_19]|uniref:Single-stranded DNA-binding protein n=1 Tax=Candidatus Wolfebacteria bacterium RIFCSPLOWO2_01_FULL_45_19 TaxID=1802557 RepID=A0A1F8DQT9_9BACT|nr:MAG: Single-stranded DNA-binding protein [Parcubacteria group bacterium GW2011_GWB1_45_9]OGM90974.1 MAG: single-stranded DNA-binding protein [Candidatus Wolfebacteria bacterium RIFCSPLOWO2_01_FULL_45_19]
MNLNKVFLAGNLTRDPELKALPSGATVASFGMATNRVWKDQKGDKKEDVQFHNVVVWGRQAEITAQFLTKGSLVLIEGRLQTRSWDGKDGTKQYRTEIVAERLQFGPRTASARTEQRQQPQATAKEEVPIIEIEENEVKPEDLPF